jgi:peptidyl-prolyl cis-trans isomerase C
VKAVFRWAPRLAASALLAAAFAWSQQTPPPGSQTTAPAQPAPTPGPAQPGQTAAPPPPDSGLKVRGPEVVSQRDPNRIVAIINGEKITARDAAHMLTYLPPDRRKQCETAPGGLAQCVQDVYLTLDFAKQAEKLHLDEAPQYKDQLLLARAPILGQAYMQYITTQNFNISEADIEKAYNDHAADYEQMKLAGIFVSYVAAGGKPPANGKSRTAEEAKAKAEELVKKIRGGGDFAALAKTDSDDASSAGKGGEIGTFTVGTSKQRLPPDIYPEVMKLHKGEASDPIDRKTGYWIFYMADRAQQSFGEVRAAVLEHIHTEHAQEVMGNALKQYHIQVQDNDFFSTAKPEATTAPKIPSLQSPPPKP